LTLFTSTLCLKVMICTAILGQHLHATYFTLVQARIYLNGILD
jgi:uncharacterized membrane protein